MPYRSDVDARTQLIEALRIDLADERAKNGRLTKVQAELLADNERLQLLVESLANANKIEANRDTERQLMEAKDLRCVDEVTYMGVRLSELWEMAQENKRRVDQLKNLSVENERILAYADKAFYRGAVLVILAALAILTITLIS